MDAQPIRILNLEDSAIDSELIVKELERAGLRFSASRVETEIDFRAALENDDPDVILADYNLPGFDGLKALQIARELVPDTPFIFVSGSIGEDRAVQALHEGATDYVIKDRLARLASAVTRSLADRNERSLMQRTQEAVRRLSRHNEMILMYAAEAIVGIDLAGKATFANPAAAEMTGWSIEEIQSAPSVDELIHSSHGNARDRSEVSPFDRCMKEGCVTSGDEVFARKSGDSFPARFTCSPIFEGPRVIGSVFLFEDVTQRKRLEQQLERVNRVSGLGRVAATIAHEFNNVLMGIQPFAELIRRRSDDEKVQKAAAQISSSVARGKRVTEEILRFTQPVEPTHSLIVLDVWLRELQPELQQLAGNRIEILLDLPAQAIVVSGDAAQLQQVLTNLTLNARDAMSGAGHITISIDEDGGFARISVHDTGVGMSEDVLRSVFEPLFTTKRTGTGLGLAVAQQVISRHGGTIHVESKVGEGTTFVILLPGVGETEPRVSTGSDSPARVRRILVVEDDPMVATGIVILLEAEGFEVRVVHRGSAAVGAIDELQPDAVILDMNLPDIRGIDLYDAIAAKDPSLPVLFSSGHDESDLVARRSSGAKNVGFLLKPYGLDALTGELQRILSGRD